MDQSAANFASNLRTLCRSAPSISEVCRRLNISRQQFNKYLSGQHLPSRSNLDRIAGFFSVAPELLTGTPQVFAAKMGSKPQHMVRAIGELPRCGEFLDTYQNSRADTARYCGVYERYQNSSIYVGMVLRSILIIKEQGEFVCHAYVERFQDLDAPRHSETIFKFRGVTSFIAGRLLMVDFEGVRRNEVTSTFLVPQMRGTSPMLFGLTMGVAASLAREPFSTRVALRRVGTGAVKPSHVRLAGALEPDDATIPTEIRRFLKVDQKILRAMDLFGSEG